MNFLFKRVMLALLATLMLTASVASVSAYYQWRDPYYSYDYPIYTSGHYYQPYTYGFSGWNYNRVYYNYHRPYYAYGGGYNAYPSYYYSPGWTRYYTVAVWPVYPAYSWPGYYW